MRVEQRGKSLGLLCTCCDLPFARLQFARLVIESNHHGTKHSNALDLEDLRMIIEALTDDGGIMRAVPPR
jgi:hypothetical protein